MSTMPAVEQIAAHPLFGLALTIGAYVAATRLHVAAGRNPLLHPVLTSVAAVGFTIWVLEIDYGRYFAQAAPLHHALGLLVVPLVRRWNLIRNKHVSF